MSTAGSVRSGDSAQQLQPELTQNSSSEESFVFNRDVSSEQGHHTTPDLNEEGTFVIERDETFSEPRPNTVDTDLGKSEDLERAIELDHNGGRESLVDKDSTFVDDEIHERLSMRLASEKTEYLMSEQEIAEWDRRMEELVERFQKQQEEYEKWENNLNRRRLLAYERLKRLKACHTRRVDLYNAVTGYIDDINSLLESKSVSG